MFKAGDLVYQTAGHAKLPCRIQRILTQYGIVYYAYRRPDVDDIEGSFSIYGELSARYLTKTCRLELSLFGQGLGE